MKHYFVDSNIFLRLLIGDNRRMSMECLVFFEKIKKGEINAVTSNIVLSEIVWTLGSFYKFPKEKVTNALKSILSMSNLEITDNYQTLLALEMYEKTSAKFIDSLISSMPDIFDKNWAVVSYDKDFDKLDIVRKEPSQIV